MSEIHPPPFEVSDDKIMQEPILRFFHYAHLPPKLKTVSEPFCKLALVMFDTLPRSAERAAGLRKLLEAKDCAVRASLGS